ncbi:hypothetical protein D5086_005727 [Populus alba]|uniref:Uncharacterized protein n=1 Tax=Populus alba TaxID=43335 RepID=A0ACC4CVR1_POPAL
MLSSTRGDWRDVFEGPLRVIVLGSQPKNRSVSRPGIENFARLENRTEPWFVVFDAPWRRFSRVDRWYPKGISKAENSALEHYHYTIFPASKPVKYSSEKRDIDSLLAFVNSLQCLRACLDPLLIHLQRTRVECIEQKQGAGESQ